MTDQLPTSPTSPTSPPLRPPPPAPRDRAPLVMALGLVLVAVSAVGLAATLLVGGDRPTRVATSVPPSPTHSPSVAPTPTRSPTVSATASPTPRPTRPRGSSAPSISPEIADAIEEIESQVAPIRGLEPEREVTERFLDEAGLLAEIQRAYDEENPPELLKAQQYALIRLGLLPADTDLTKTVIDLLGGQVIGFYDPRTREMTIIDRASGFGTVEKMTIAHEYTHALQDQRFGLESLGRNELGESDTNLARLALIEGDASLLMTQWAGQNLSPAELAELASLGTDPAQLEALEEAPPFLQRQLSFPYNDGLLFVSDLWTRGGWSAVDAAYAKLPDSSEQILHPAKYRTGELPSEVDLPELERTLGEGWTRSLIDTFGELTLSVWLDQALDQTAATDGATGWGGDRVGAYEGPGGAWAIAWQTDWDTAADAQEFLDGARAVLAALPARSEATAAGETRVTVLLASDDAVLGQLRAAVPAGS